ncbi:ComEC/Rec2 family competence protein [Miniphocaeibacter halophilus]|uniref:MBL fold metallo-hydrolase n=1 Tax=Miniphocaeibacter halophilus TaxID=2931922 RepID=A0AC61MQ76_9FIRM|nr:ComEC/Rec2 family competence protein [Miniphocaeibacter halophilus]QQK07734.1 MBL fold metallo-hydrolase [Miniphocaeibacter halophilus]
MKKITKKKIISLIIALLITAFGGITVTENLADNVNSDLEVHFIDVGQGDSTLLISKGESILIDGGERHASSKVVSYIEKLGINKIDYVIATHPHSDHISGLIGVINKYEVKNIIRNEEEVDSKIYDSFVNAYESKNINTIIPKVGDSFKFGEANFEILGPTAYNFDTNNNSLAVKVNHGENSFLFTGDAEKLEESTLMYTGEEIDAKILHIGHHGSRKASSEEFLKEVNPEYGIISVGKDNMYGHPHKEALNRLEKHNIKTYRTDISGDIIIISDGEEILISTEK